MSFLKYRAQKYSNQCMIEDGKCIFTITRFEEISEVKYLVGFESKRKESLENTFSYDANKYGPLDALIDAALGHGVVDFTYDDLIGKHVLLHLLNETKNGRTYTNIKRIDPVDEEVEDNFDEENLPVIEEEDFSDSLDDIDEM